MSDDNSTVPPTTKNGVWAIPLQKVLKSSLRTRSDSEKTRLRTLEIALLTRLMATQTLKPCHQQSVREVLRFGSSRSIRKLRHNLSYNSKFPFCPFSVSSVCRTALTFALHRIGGTAPRRDRSKSMVYLYLIWKIFYIYFDVRKCCRTIIPRVCITAPSPRNGPTWTDRREMGESSRGEEGGIGGGPHRR